MEIDAVVKMFRRSEILHTVKYASYIDEGDSKTFIGITDATPYENITVLKEKNA